MNSLKTGRVLLLVAVIGATSSCLAMQQHPMSGWSDGVSTKGLGQVNDVIWPKVTLDMPLGEGAGITRAPQEITSLAISSRRLPWVTTKDGKILRLRDRSQRGGPAQRFEWQDVSAMFSSSLARDASTQPKFKYVSASPYTGTIYAIDEEGQVYRWDNAGRGNEEDN